MIAFQTLRLACIRLGAIARRSARDEDGATLVEYGLLVALITVVVMATVAVLGVNINSMFCSVVGRLGGTCP